MASSLPTLRGRLVDLSVQLPVNIAAIKSRSLGSICGVVVHHSATPRTVTSTQIWHYHRFVLDWPSIAYHYTIYPNGCVAKTLEPTYVGYHCASRQTRENISVVNWESIGVCLIGCFIDGVSPTPEQESGLVALIRYLDGMLRQAGTTLRPLYVMGHGDGDYPTRCPGDNFHRWLDPCVKQARS